MKTVCWLFHRWPRWSAVEQVDVTVRNSIGGALVGEFEVTRFRQERTCEWCGKTEVRLARASDA